MIASNTVHVGAKDIRAAEAGDCFRCAVARAMQRATGDSEARVVEADWQLRLVVWGRLIVAPDDVRAFVRELDGLPRTRKNRPRLPKKLVEPVAPFTFELPAWSDPEWEEECQGCEQLFAPGDLDDDGYCEECRQ